MSYQEDSIDWQDVQYIDEWLDSKVSPAYQEQPLAQDWARLSKVSEELGEAIQEFIGLTGQNPRKGVTSSEPQFLEEVADTLITALLCMQHFTKDTWVTREIIRSRIERTAKRARVSMNDVRPPDSEHGLHP